MFNEPSSLDRRVRMTEDEKHTDVCCKECRRKECGRRAWGSFQYRTSTTACSQLVVKSTSPNL